MKASERSRKSRESHKGKKVVVYGFVWDELTTALAKVNAAFPAGDYKFNSLQNLAMNHLNDAMYMLADLNQEFRNKVNEEAFAHYKWVIGRLLKSGTISRELADKGISSYRKRFYEPKKKELESHGKAKKAIKGCKSGKSGKPGKSGKSGKSGKRLKDHKDIRRQRL